MQEIDKGSALELIESLPDACKYSQSVGRGCKYDSKHRPLKCLVIISEGSVTAGGFSSFLGPFAAEGGSSIPLRG